MGDWAPHWPRRNPHRRPEIAAVRPARLDHSTVSRAEYDDALHALGRAEQRIRDLSDDVVYWRNLAQARFDGR